MKRSKLRVTIIGLYNCESCQAYKACKNHYLNSQFSYCYRFLGWLRYYGKDNKYSKGYRYKQGSIANRVAAYVYICGPRKERIEAIVTLFKLKYPMFNLEVKVEDME